MTTLKEISIPENQLKLRWREPYVTDGTNKALAVLDPGAYRGCYARETDPISTSFRITAEGEQDNSFLWVDKATGTALSILYGTDVLVDMAPQFSGPGGTLPSAQTWYVWLDCSYSVGAATTGKFYVGTTAPTSANAVKIARINMPNGVMSILTSYIDWSTSYRTVAHVDRPILLSKAVTKSVSTNKFQLTGKVYLPGGTFNMGWRDYYINLLGGSGLGRWAYTGDDGASIWVKNVYADSGLSVSILADSEGFVEDPWVELDVSQTTDPTPPMCYVRYWTRGTLRDLVLDDQIKSDWLPHDHALWVSTRAKSGYPTSLTAGSAQSQIEALLTAVNERISAKAPESAPANPVLLWRSHNIASDALVTGTTISIYWGSSLGFAVIVGGYISGANAVRALVSPADTMVLLRLHGNADAGPELLSSPTSQGATMAWNLPSGWSTRLYSLDISGISSFAISNLTLVNAIMELNNHNSYIKGNTPGSGGLNSYCKLFESIGSDVRMRLYYGDGSFWITFNAHWVQSHYFPGWKQDSDEVNAMAVGIGTYDDCPSLRIKIKQKGNFSSDAWFFWDFDLDYGVDISGYCRVAPVVNGNYKDICKYLLQVQSNPEAGGSVSAYSKVDFHASIPDIPNVISFEVIDSYGTWSGATPTVLPGSIDEYGLIIFQAGTRQTFATISTYGNVLISE